MSHTATYDKIITNIKTFCNVASKLGHKVKLAPTGQTIKIQQYGQNWVNDAVAEVHLDGWRFPLAIKESGEILYDHWGSAAKTMDHLGEVLQEYNHQLISDNIDYTEVDMVNVTVKDNGEKVITMIMQ